MNNDKKEDEELRKEIDNDRMKLEESFEKTKISLATAGLLVALSLNASDFKTISLFGHSAYKLTLLCIAGAALSMLFSYLVVGKNLNLLKQFFFAESDIKQKSKEYKRFHFLLALANALNALTTWLIVAAFVLFAYLVFQLPAHAVPR